MDKESSHSVSSIQKRFAAIVAKAERQGISTSQLARLPSVKNLQNRHQQSNYGYLKRILVVILLCWMVLQSLILGTWVLEWPVTRFELIDTWFWWYDSNIEKEACVVSVPEFVQDFARPLVDCRICREVVSVPRVTNISRTEFEQKYAYTGKPVIISDGARNWSALQTFSFDFFKSIYSKDSPVLQSNCQFFPYRSGFESLQEVFSMSEERARLQLGTEPWYIGWSNCDSSATNVLRAHYERPYFLPAVAEASKTDWIFMGSPEYGAHMHIDNVGNPSWQAQLSGVKQWTLEPPPECYYECPHRVILTVQPGEIFVLDTDRWFHSTLILGNEMSITIGSEYD